jgi:hypothetical protein
MRQHVKNTRESQEVRIAAARGVNRKERGEEVSGRNCPTEPWLFSE